MSKSRIHFILIIILTQIIAIYFAFFQPVEAEYVGIFWGTILTVFLLPVRVFVEFGVDPGQVGILPYLFFVIAAIWLFINTILAIDGLIYSLHQKSWKKEIRKCLPVIRKKISFAITTLIIFISIYFLSNIIEGANLYFLSPHSC